MGSPSQTFGLRLPSTGVGPGIRGVADVQRWPPRHWPDVLLWALLSTCSYALAHQYLREASAAGLKPEFYQNRFGPAVMVACGRGFVSPDVGASPALDAFLRVERDAITCDALPTGLRLTRLEGQQRAWKYLLLTSAAIWRVGGISWTTLSTLSALLFAATIGLTFGLTRVFAGRAAASFAAIGTLLSPLQWSQVPNLRDYSKAPFVLASILLIAMVGRFPVRPRRLLGVAVAFGAVLGIGAGFRQDSLIAAPLFVLAVMVFLPGRFSEHLGLKAGMLVVSLVAFGVSAWPLLPAYGKGGGVSVQHVALLGMTTPFDDALGVKGGPYEFGYAYNDSYMAARIIEFGHRQQHAASPISTYGAGYNDSANGLIRALIQTLPADLLIRAYASIVTICMLPTSSWTDSHLPAPLPPWSLLARLMEMRLRVVSFAPWLSPVSIVLAIVVAGAISVRLAVFATLLLFYLAGYPAIQFDERHFFHLSFVPFVAVAFLLDRILRIDFRSGARAHPIKPGRLGRAAMRVAVLAVAVAVVLIVPLWVVREYQASKVSAILTDILTTPRRPLMSRMEAVDATRVRYLAGSLPANEMAAAHPGFVTSEYLLARFGGTKCEALRIPIHLDYQGTFPVADTVAAESGRALSVSLPPDSPTEVTVVAPVFYRYARQDDTNRLSYQFLGLEINADDRDCLTGLERIADTQRFPLLLSAVLAPGWQRSTLYQTLRWENRSGAALMNFATAPRDLRITRAILNRTLQPVPVQSRADEMQETSQGHLSMDGIGGIGTATGQFVYLLEGRPQQVAAGDQLIVDGELRGGGLSIGLVRDGRWLIQTPVVKRGRFLAVVEVPSDGVCTVVIANNASPQDVGSRFDVRRFGWLSRAETN